MDTTTTDTETTTEESTPTPSFDDLGLTEEVRRAIAEMDWENPTPVQVESYGGAVAGKDLIVQARTGTGKTGAFGIPLVDRIVETRPGVQALVLAPTRELALQSAREIGRLGAHRGVKSSAVYGGAPMDKQIRELAEGAQIVSGTPGRVLDHLKRGTLDPSGLKCLVLDEADEMLSMGFAKELNAIIELLPESRQTLLFSATVEGQVLRIAQRHMTDPEFVTLSGDAIGALGVSHFVYMVSGMGREQDLIRILEIEDPESAIVFCNTKVETERVAVALQNAGFSADWLNGDLPQSEREKVMGRCRSGQIRFLVATDVAARGIDISHLTHVINYGLPEHIEQYVHRTGRTGRAGRTGTAIALVSPQELGTLYYLRLQYKIFPVERSLPTKGEERTRIEADRIGMLEEAMSGPIDEMDLAVARRLLTHPEVERLLAGLLATFFGTHGGDVDEEAAAVRRARAPEPVEEDDDEDEREDDEGGGRRRRARRRERRPRAERESRAASEDREDSEVSEDEDQDDRASETATVWINLGRRDDVRADDIARFMGEEAGVEDDAILRIRVRDKHSFVDVDPEALPTILEGLEGKSFGDREVIAERARPRR